VRRPSSSTSVAGSVDPEPPVERLAFALLEQQPASLAFRLGELWRDPTRIRNATLLVGSLRGTGAPGLLV